MGRTTASIPERYDQSVVPVGSYIAGQSPYGVLDIAGNVGGWTSDWYDKDKSIFHKKNTSGPIMKTDKVTREGDRLDGKTFIHF